MVDGCTTIRLPLVLYNTGPKPIVVQDLRLVLPSESPMPLLWQGSYGKLDSTNDDDRVLPSVFVVPGRSALQFFMEFERNHLSLGAEKYNFKIGVRCGHFRIRRWRSLLTFTLYTGNIDDPDQFVAYRNMP